MKAFLFSTICALILIKAFSCPSSRSFQHSTCVFYFDNRSSCQNFGFIFCTWQSCFSEKPISKDTNCANPYQNKSSDWSQCTSNCCDSSISYAQTWDSLNQCQTFINIGSHESGGSAAVLATLIIIGVFGLCCVCCCCRIGFVTQCCKLTKYFFGRLIACQCFKKVAEVRSIDHNISQEGLPATIAHKQTDKHLNEWKQVTQLQVNQSVEQTICCICLQSRPTLELQCRHRFHIICMKQCLRKKTQCPLCRRTQINNIHLYCESCFHFYLCSTLSDFFSHRISLSQSCTNCIRSREVQA